MPLGLRQILRAAAGLSSVVSLAAEPEALPPIFAPKIPAAAPVPQTPIPPADTSDRMRRLLAADVLQHVTIFRVPLPVHAAEGAALPGEEAAVVMKEFHVNALPLRSVEFARPTAPLVELLKKGLLYHSVGKNLEMDGTVNFSQVTSYTSGNNGTAPKVEVRFNFRW